MIVAGGGQAGRWQQAVRNNNPQESARRESNSGEDGSGLSRIIDSTFNYWFWSTNGIVDNNKNRISPDIIL